MKDALGNEVVFGNLYGYSSSNNGFSSVTIGIAIRETKTGISLKPLSKIEALYNKEPEPVQCANNVHIKSIHLFPLNKDDINKHYYRT